MFTQLFARVPRGSLLAGAPKVQVRPELSLPWGGGGGQDAHSGHLAMRVLPLKRCFSQNAALVLLDPVNVFILHESAHLPFARDCLKPNLCFNFTPETQRPPYLLSNSSPPGLTFLPNLYLTWPTFSFYFQIFSKYILACCFCSFGK